MKEIAKLALLAIRNVEPSCELSSDICLFIMDCIIGWVKTIEVMQTADSSEFKEDQIFNLMHELDHICTSSLVDEFLNEGSNENV